MAECQIISVDSGPSVARPSIISFQNGQLQAINQTNLKCAKYFDPEQNKTVTAVATNRLVYSGEENSEDVNTFLAIRNKRTNTVRIVQINSVSLNPQIRVSSMLETTLNNSSLNVRDLYKQFGSKKTKRQTEQIEKMKMDATNVEEELKEAIADIEIKEEDLVIPIGDDDLEYIPKINRKASIVEEVYDLKNIITQNELDSLKKLATEVINKSTIEEQLTPFALYCINTLKRNPVENLEKYEIALYIDGILKFFQIPTTKINTKGFTITPYPHVISQKILKVFSVVSHNHRLRPFTMRDKAICYVLVLALIALNFKVNVTDLPTSVHCGIRKILEISRSLGATLKENNCIVLKLPLTAPLKRRLFNQRK